MLGPRYQNHSPRIILTPLIFYDKLYGSYTFGLRRLKMSLKGNVIVDFPFRGSVQMLVRNSAYQPGTLQSLAERIYTHSLNDKPFAEALQRYVDLCYTIDKIKVSTLGQQASTLRSNALMQAISIIFGREAFSVEGCVEKIERHLKDIESEGGRATWLYPKLEVLRHSMRRAQMLDWLADSLRLPALFVRFINPDVFAGAAAEAGRQARTLVNELVVLRKYGIKQSYFQDGLLHNASQAWAFMDFRDVRQAMTEHRQFALKEPLALVGLAEKEQLTSIGIDEHVRIIGEGRMRGVSTKFGASAFMCVDEDAELDASFGFGLMPARQFFVRRQNEAIYEALRYAQAIRLYDLTVPLMIVAKMPQPRVPGGGLIAKVRQLATLKNKFSFDLIVPRLRTFDHVNQLVRDLEIEVEQGIDETVLRARHDMRRHDVVWHVRRLPSGKHPTAEAVARAAEFGIVLADNETFVRPHERGKGQCEDRIHRAKARR